MVSHCCSSYHIIRHVWDSQRFARKRPAKRTQAAAVHCSIERLFCRVQSTTPSSERSTMLKRIAVSHACMRVRWCYGASSKRRRHQMSWIITTTGSRCGREKLHGADCAPPDDQVARFQQRSRRHIVQWTCIGRPRQQQQQRSPAAAAAGTRATPVRQRRNGRSRRFRGAESRVSNCHM